MQFRRLHITVLLLLISGWANFAFGQRAPSVGTSIKNVALYSFVDSIGFTQSGKSNFVEALIDEKVEMLLYPDQFLTQRKNRSILFEHNLTNKGNAINEIAINVANTSHTDFDFQDFKITVFTVADNGIPLKQTQTQITDITESITLNPLDTKRIKIEAFIPDVVTVGQIGSIHLSIRNNNNQILVQNTDSVQIIAGTQIELNKVILETSVIQNGDITFEINGKNTGDVAALAVPILVDNIEKRFVLLKDFIPPNTTFKTFELTTPGTPLYHIIGSPANQYRSLPSDDLSFIDQIAVGYSVIDVKESFKVRFKVTVNENATGDIENIAVVTYDDGLGEQTAEGASNLVVARLPTRNPIIKYYTDATFTVETNITDIGEPLFIQADAAGCNKHSLWADSTIITIDSQLTGDEESFLAIETGRNNGIFRINNAIPTRDFSLFPTIKNNEILETTANDALIATLEGCGVGGASATIKATVYVAPVGVVFDSESNRPIPKAKVQILNITLDPNGVPAQVFDSKGINTLPNEVETIANGEFVFPRLNPGRYKIVVTAPYQYNFPSVLTKEQFPVGRNVIDEASWGREFTIGAPFGPARFDVPLDVNGLLAMDLTKKADREVVDLGGFVNYQIQVSNLIQNDIKNVEVTDTIPFGFVFVNGSAKVDGVSVADPMGGKGPILKFMIGDLAINGKKSLTYRLKTTPGAVGSEGKNVAYAFADELIDKISKEANVTVRVDKGVFADEAFIIGKVFYDKNKNRIQDLGEPGVPGIRIYMENGNYVKTDALGKYSFYGVRPRRHVLKLDVTTIPEGGGLVILDNRHANDASSRFVDLQKGELHKADFAICDDTEDILSEIKTRFVDLTDMPAELAQGLQARLEAKSIRINRNSKALPSSGLVGNIHPESKGKSFKPLLKDAANSNYWITETFVSTNVSMDELLSVATPELDFLNLHNNDSLRTSITSIMVKGPKGSKFGLSINGEEVKESRIGKKSNSETTEGWEFVGVQLHEGENTIVVKQFDPFGNERQVNQITVYAPGLVDHILVSVLDEHVPADGKSIAKVKIELLDKNNIKVKTRTPIFIDISLGKPLTEDLNPKEAGIQQFIEGGDGIMFIEAPLEPGTSKIKVQSGLLKAETSLDFIPNLRPLIAAGIIEGAIRLKNGFRVESVHNGDVFEEELRSLNSGGNGFSASARTAFFIKGKILGSYLLTASFDSEKDDRGMFRDIQPDEFYPIYGDASVKGFDAQSSGRLFVRVDKNKNFALYGDFTTMDQSPQRNLGQFTRNLTGTKAHFENDKVKANVSLSLADSRQIIEELPALGISGPYKLRYEDIKENSERIEIITRDRNQPDVIIKTEILTRFKDYSIESFSGHVFFTMPVFSLDEQLNPRFIRVSYETKESIEKYVVATSDAQVKINEKIEVGGTAHVDLDPTNSYNLVSANSAFALNENNIVVAEVAHSSLESKGNDFAGRLEYKHQGKVVNGRVFAGKTGSDFVNPFSMLGGARTEAGLRGTFRLTEKTMMQAEALLSKNDTTGATRQGFMLNMQRGFSYGLQAELGMRYSKDDQKSGVPATEQGTVRGKLQSQLPFLTSAQVYGEYEQSIASIDRKIAALGADYQLGSRGRLYARHEFISSLSGRYSLNDNQQQNNTVIGLDAGYMRNGRVYTEYRSRDAFDGRSTQASMGVRNQFMISEGLGITAGLERVFSIAGTAVNEGTSVSLGLDYTANPNWKASARVETRFSKLEDAYITTLGYAHRITEQWSFLGKNTLAISKGGSGDRTLERMRSGFAFRQSEYSKWNALGRYEYSYELNNGFSSGIERSVHMVSSHVNWQPNDPLYISSRWAGRIATEKTDGFESQSFMQLLGLRAIYDLTKRFDLGLSTAVLSNADFSSRQVGLGAEVGFIVAKNLRLAGGYNFLGYSDRDLASSDYTANGVYLSLHYKFDEQEIYRVTKSTPDDYPDLDCGCDEPTFVMPSPVIPELVATVPIPKIILEKVVLPQDVHFALNKSFISEISGSMISRMAWFMQNNASTTINLAGHTDSRSTSNYNFYLSKRRAESVKAFMIASGVDSTRIKIYPHGKDQRRIQSESNIVNEAENRRVEFELKDASVPYELVSQVEDLQIEKRELKNASYWDFLISTEILSVADRVHFKPNQSSLSALSKILLGRISAVLKQKENVHIFVYGFAESDEKLVQERAKSIITYLEEAGISAERIQFELRFSGASDKNKRGENSLANAIFIDYEPEKDLEILEQKDDLEGQNAAVIPQALYRMLEIQQSRNDMPLIESPSKSNVFVPSSVHFSNSNSNLDHKSQAILMRLVIFLKKNVNANVEIMENIESGNALKQSSSNSFKRVLAVFEFLRAQGIPATRIRMGITKEPKSAEKNEWERALNRKVDIRIQNVKQVKYVDQTYDVKPKGWK